MAALADVWSWGEEVWYVVEYARSGRSTCKEFRCKQTIKQGELRIGIHQEVETDHAGTDMGWFHPECLWKTFTFKKNANKKITSKKDLDGWNKISAADQAILTDLIEGKKRATTEPVAAANADPNGLPAGVRGKVTLEAEVDDVLFLSGATFDIKEQVKAKGARWDGARKGWKFQGDFDKVGLQTFFGLADLPAPGSSFTIDLAALAKRAADGGSPAKKSRK